MTHFTGDYYCFDYAGTEHGVVREADAATVMTQMNGLYCTEHRFAKNSVVWQTLYQRGQRNLYFMDPHQTIHTVPPAGGGLLWTYPCHYCGILLPEEIIEVDHHKPESFPALGLLKLFHSFTMPNGDALTIAGAKGQKNLQRVAISAGGPVAPVMVKGKPFGDTWAEKDPITTAGLDDRYTLTDVGETLLTLVLMCWGSSAGDRLGKNNLLNLVPACPRCNKHKTNLWHGV